MRPWAHVRARARTRPRKFLKMRPRTPAHAKIFLRCARARPRTRKFENMRTRTPAHAKIWKHAPAHARARENLKTRARARPRTREFRVFWNYGLNLGCKPTAPLCRFLSVFVGRFYRFLNLQKPTDLFLGTDNFIGFCRFLSVFL